MVRYLPQWGVLAGLATLALAGCGSQSASGFHPTPFPSGNPVAGAQIYKTTCISCHAANGQGTPGVAPPLVGQLSKFQRLYGNQAGLARFIYYNMPVTNPGSLSKQQAADLAAFIYGINNKATASNLFADLGKVPAAPSAPPATPAPSSPAPTSTAPSSPAATPTPQSSTAPALPNAAAAIAAGKQLYAKSCATCHGTNGQGGVGPALWGPNGLIASSPYNSLAPLQQFIKTNMPLSAPGSLSQQQATDAAAFILNQNHIKP